MSSNPLNLQNISIMRKALTASEEQADAFLKYLPEELAGRIRDRITESTKANSTTPLRVAIKEITLESLKRSENQNKIYGIFYEVCKPTTKDSKWGEHHIADDDKIDQLLESVETAIAKNMLSDGLVNRGLRHRSITDISSKTDETLAPRLQPTIEPAEIGRMPGIVSILCFPFDLVYNIFKLTKAVALGDKEATLEAKIRLSSLPINFFGSTCSILTMLYQLSSFFKAFKINFITISLNSAAIVVFNISGLILSIIECVVEMMAIKRQVSFLKHLNIKNLPDFEKFIHEKDIEVKTNGLLKAVNNLLETPNLPISPSLKSTLTELKISLSSKEDVSESTMKLAIQALDQVTIDLLMHDAEYIHENYLCLTKTEVDKIDFIVKASFTRSSQEKITTKIDETQSNWMNVKSNNLARRVAPWCAEELNDRLAPILLGLKSADPEVKKRSATEMKELLSSAEIQAKKFLILHCASLAVFAISACVAVASLVMCPPLVPLIGIFTIFIVSTISCLAHQGMIKQRGWKFCFSDCIPDFIKTTYTEIPKVFCSVQRQCITASA